MKTNEAIKSLEVLTWNDEDTKLGLPARVRESIAAEYGDLSFEERAVAIKSSYGTGSVKFGVSQSHNVKTNKTPGLHLLSLCIQLDSIANKPVNSGLVLRIDSGLLPQSIMTWLQERRNRMLNKVAEPVNS